MWGAMWGVTRSVLLSSKLSYLVRDMFCAPGRTRTYDRQIRRLLLYPLSYGGQRPELCRTRRILRSNILSAVDPKRRFRAILMAG
jgi:hypothetical protein